MTAFIRILADKSLNSISSLNFKVLCDSILEFLIVLKLIWRTMLIRSLILNA
jgi:hypothetical protein